MGNEFGLGIVVYVLSSWCTLALFYVAWTDGECSSLIITYVMKNLSTLVLALILFGADVAAFFGRLNEEPFGSLNWSHAILSSVLSVIFNFVTPVISTFIAMRYHTSIRFLQRSIMSLLNQYERALNLKRGKIRVVSTKAKKVPMKKTPFIRSGKTGSDKLRQNQQRVQEWVEDQSSFKKNDRIATETELTESSISTISVKEPVPSKHSSQEYKKRV